jgi:hypothetical protein
MTTLITNDNGVDRPMTPAEQAEYETKSAQALIQQQELDAALADQSAARASARAKLAALGLTETEIKALVG